MPVLQRNQFLFLCSILCLFPLSPSALSSLYSSPLLPPALSSLYTLLPLSPSVPFPPASFAENPSLSDELAYRMHTEPGIEKGWALPPPRCFMPLLFNICVRKGNPLYSLSTAQIFLKGKCHEIYKFRVLPESASPRLLVISSAL
jgi:hypothetical protein